MDLFELAAKITLDDSDYQTGMAAAVKTSETAESALKELQSPLDGLQKAFNAIANPVKTVQSAFEDLKEKTETIRHPIQSLTTAWDSAKNSVENKRTATLALANSLEVAKGQYEQSRQKVQDLEKALNESVKTTGAASTESRYFAAALESEKNACAEAKTKMTALNDELGDASSKGGLLKTALDNISNVASGALTTGLDIAAQGIKVFAQAATVALGAASTAVVALAKSSLDSYADYEQLVGGVETLFGDSSSTVQEYAANAYKTAGMSANDYMETVTSFSASLLQSLDNDTAKAAEKADLAITDMSDNANKMGTSMESIQNAYQGFAKQNYTMLDNLKLGYGGTKEEMERLIEDANKLNAAQGITTEYTIDSYADIVDAIHVVQTEMGITGTTADEAATTIQGSTSSMQAAWSNLLTGLADENADMGELINEVVDSALTVADNVIPRIEQILTGIGDAVTRVAPIIVEKLPEMLDKVLPSLLTAGTQLLQAVMDGIISVLPTLSDAAVQIVMTVATFLVENLPTLIEAALALILTIADGIVAALPEMIPAIVDVALQIVTTLLANLDKIINAAFQIIVALALGLVQAIPQLLAAVPQLLTALGDSLKRGISDFLEIGSQLVQGLWDGIQNGWNWLTDKVSSLVNGLVDGVKGLLGIHSPSRVFASIGGYMAEGLGEGWDDEFESVKKEINDGLNFGAASVGLNATYSSAGTAGAGSSGLLASGVSIVQNIYSEAKTAAQLMKEARYEAEMAVLVGV